MTVPNPAVHRCGTACALGRERAKEDPMSQPSRGWRTAALVTLAALALSLVGAAPLRAAGGVATVQIEQPTEGQHVLGPVTIRGWAADLDQTLGTGVDQLVVTLDAPINQGQRLGDATTGLDRPDLVSTTNNPNLANAGFSFTWDSTTTAPGTHGL